MRASPTKPAYRGADFDPLVEGLRSRLGVLGAALDYQAGTRLGWHVHPYAQFVYAISGAMLVRTRGAMFIVPPPMAVWVPPGMEHSVAMHGATSMRTVYFTRDRLPRSDGKCVVVSVSVLLRELILALIDRQSARGHSGVEFISALLRHEIAGAATEPLALPTPSDRRAQKVVSLFASGSPNTRKVAQASQNAGVSLSTLERIFKRETGLTFGRWRRQARLLRSISELAEGKPVTQIAFDAGYSTSSAYAYMFRRALGKPPTHYLSLHETE